MIFANNAKKLWSNGWFVTPTSKEKKTPYLKGFNNRAKQGVLETEEEIDEIVKINPNANIMILSSQEYYAIDIDTNDEEALDFVRQNWPIMVERVGNKGFVTLFRRGEFNPDLYRDVVSESGAPVFEIKANGKKGVVWAPSIHPNGNEYVEVGDFKAYEISPEDLPELTKVQFDEVYDFFVSRYASYDKATRRINPNEGRNSRAYSIVTSGFARGFSNEKILLNILEDDGGYFSDPDEWEHVGNPEANAKHFIERIAKDVIGYKAQRGEIQSEVQKGPISRPQANGFYYQTDEGVHKPDYHSWGEYLRKNLNLCQLAGGYYHFVKGTHYFKPEEKENIWLNHMILNFAGRKLQPAHLDNFLKIGKSYAKPIRGLVQPHGILNLKNGVLDVKSSGLMPHDPKFFFQYVADYEFNPHARCPQWEAWLLKISIDDPDWVKVLQEIFGYIILGGRPFMQNFIYFKGEGGNGKSTVLNMLKKMLGSTDHTYSEISLGNINDEKYAIKLKDVLVNISDESPKNIDSETMKRISAGGSIYGRNLFENLVKFESTARIIFSANDTPNFSDHSHGLLRRLVIVPFDYMVSEKEKNEFIEEELFDPEISGILNWALEGAKRLLSNNKKFTQCERIRDAHEKYKIESNSCIEFAEENLNVTGSPSDSLALQNIYKHYVNWCESEGKRPMGKKKLTDFIERWAVSTFEKQGRKGTNLFVPQKFKSNGIRKLRSIEIKLG